MRGRCTSGVGRQGGEYRQVPVGQGDRSSGGGGQGDRRSILCPRRRWSCRVSLSPPRSGWSRWVRSTTRMTTWVWTSSVDHIRSTPGMQGRSWPRPEMTLADNLADLQGHASEFADRKGFTYTALATGSGEIVGCVYVYPRKGEPGARVLSWVRADRPILTCPCTKPSRSGHGPPGRLPRSLTPRDEPGSASLRPVAGLVAHSLQSVPVGSWAPTTPRRSPPQQPAQWARLAANSR